MKKTGKLQAMPTDCCILLPVSAVMDSTSPSSTWLTGAQLTTGAEGMASPAGDA